MNTKINTIYKSIISNKFKTKIIRKRNSKHVFVNADCEEVMKTIPDNSIDLIITDPPYNKSLDYGKRFNDRKTKEEYYNWLRAKLVEIPRILSPRGSLYLIGYPEKNARLLPYLEDELKLKFCRWITWHYPTNIGHSRRNFTRSQRSILFFSKTNRYIFNRKNLIQSYKNPTATVIRKRLAKGYRGRTSYDLLRFLDLIELQKGLINVLDINLLKNNSRDRLRNLNKKFHPLSKKELKKKDHPCQLPPALIEILIKVSSNKNYIVLDPFAGTFTTSAAAERLKRNSVGVEINKKFLNFGLKRLKNEKV